MDPEGKIISRSDNKKGYWKRTVECFNKSING